MRLANKVWPRRCIFRLMIACCYFTSCLLVSTFAMAQQPGSSSAVASQNKAPGGQLPAATGVNPGNFCDGIAQLLKDATSNFERIRGKFIEANADGAQWTATGGLPGAITSSLVKQKEWQYEGLVYLGNSKDKMDSVYRAYARSLGDCAEANGYKARRSEPSKTLGLYDNVEYTRKEAGSAGPCVGLKVDYTDVTDTYTATIYMRSPQR